MADRPDTVPTLPAGRYVLRPWRVDDLALVREAARDPFIPLITTLPAGADDEQARAWIAAQHRRLPDGVGYPFVIAAADGEPLGQIGLWFLRMGPGRASVGYWVVRRHRRRGVVGEALRGLAQWAFTIGVERLECYVEPWNEGSWRAAEGAGFRREGLLRSWEVVGGERRDMFMYARLPSDPG